MLVGAYYWVLGDQPAEPLGLVDWFLTRCRRTCCLRGWDRPYVENYTVDASILQCQIMDTGSLFWGVGVCVVWCC